MTAFTDYKEFADGPLELPILGKVYRVPEISIPDGMVLAGIVDGSDEDAQKMKGVELWKLLLGPAWDEMIADGVPLAAATRAGLTVLADRQYGRELAQVTWETGADPKAIQPYLDLQAAKQNRAQRRSKSSGGAKKTPPRDSTKVTTSPAMSGDTLTVAESSGPTF